MAVPVSIFDARRQLRYELDDDSNDEQLHDLISRAVAWVERYTGHLMEAREVTETFEHWDRPLLRAWPIKPGAVPVIAYELGGAPMELSGQLSGRIVASRRPARLLCPSGMLWPWFAYDTGISVTFRAGYEPRDVVPGNLRSAILVMITAYHEDREGGELFTKAEASARGLCRDFRHRRL